MSGIHYFQRYSQKENVVTNNSLLLLSRIYNASYLKFSNLISSLMDGVGINFGLEFSQQVRSKTSVPDGIIKQESIKIVIETKLYNSFSTKQLLNHLHSFEDETTQILISLGPRKLSDNRLTLLQSEIKAFNASNGTQITHINTTFEDLILQFREVINDYDTELNEVIDDFELFCQSSNLLRPNRQVLLAVPCGTTYKDNLIHHIYYDPAKRNYSHFTHLGIYNRKNIIAIGEIKNIITANLVDNDLKVIGSTTPVKTNQIERIKSMIRDSQKNLGWDVSKNNKFFCVEEFIKTNYKKESPYGLQNKRYFDLRKSLNTQKNLSTVNIAKQLESKVW